MFKQSLYLVLLTFQILLACCVKANDVRVFLAISSLANTSEAGEITQRQFQLNWYNGTAFDGDWVGLFDHDPLVDSSNPLDSINATDYPENFYRSSVMYPRPDMNSLSVEKQCLGYWIGYIRQGLVIASNCIKTQPNWMWEIREYISPLLVTAVMIPGTHDAGSHKEYVAFQSDNWYSRWYVTQEESFWEQVMYGIRHFDLRLAYYPNKDEQFWVNHGTVVMNPFSEAMKAWKRFLNETNEILILDFHEFPVGFEGHPERHIQLQTYLVQEFGQYLVSPSVGYNVTVGALWKSNKRVIVAYADDAMNFSDFLWPKIPQIWADTMDINYLKSYMQDYMDSGRTDIWSAQLEFTPHDSDKYLTYSSLRVLAEEVNGNVTQWCRDLWWDKANLAAEDFFLGSNIVEVAIESNIKRGINYQQKKRQ
ncbi:hypothetical protein CHUAL_001903 [Chamberlinius hualienensis]